MSLVALALLAGIAYLAWSGGLTKARLNLLLAVGLGIAAVRLMTTGQVALGVLAGGAAVVLGGVSLGGRPDPARLAEARATLGVAEGATADEIRAAHRRLAATAHPDRGGSTEAMQRLNAARDLLLKRAPRNDKAA